MAQEQDTPIKWTRKKLLRVLIELSNGLHARTLVLWKILCKKWVDDQEEEEENE